MTLSLAIFAFHFFMPVSFLRQDSLFVFGRRELPLLLEVGVFWSIYKRLRMLIMLSKTLLTPIGINLILITRLGELPSLHALPFILTIAVNLWHLILFLIGLQHCLLLKALYIPTRKVIVHKHFNLPIQPRRVIPFIPFPAAELPRLPVLISPTALVVHKHCKPVDLPFVPTLISVLEVCLMLVLHEAVASAFPLLVADDLGVFDGPVDLELLLKPGLVGLVVQMVHEDCLIGVSLELLLGDGP